MLLTVPLWADGPGDNVADKIRRIPPPGIKIPDADRAELQAGLEALFKDIVAACYSPYADLLPDVQIFYKAVHDALYYDELYDLKEVAVAKRLLKLGSERAAALKEGKAPWTSATGLVVRGYKSKIDNSIQPYGLVVPATYKPDSPHKHRLDFWCHGRGEKLTELSFINGRLNSPGEFTPPDAFVLHLYGRYCCANKFAGEIDLFEAFEDVRKHYPIDEDRLVIRGFSMGGAACWQFAVHYPGFYCAAAPGAGFAETPEFLRVFQSEEVKPTWYEQKLWTLYDCPGYAANLFNLPTVAYSGEIDKQKQAADVMAKAIEREGMTLTHLIGPKTAHSYHKDTKVELNRLIDAIAEKGRDPLPKKIRFATYTLRYNTSHWLTVEGLEKHWKQARVEAEIVDAGNLKLTTSNVNELRLTFPAKIQPFAGHPVQITIDGQSCQFAAPPKDSELVLHLAKREGTWGPVQRQDQTLRKRHGLQGPIDDAFMDRFIMITPTGKPMHEKTGRWVDAEMKHAIEHWRRQFRGEALVLKDTAVIDENIANSNLILWGDPSSNKFYQRIADKLPLRWNDKAIVLGDKSFSADHHMPVLIIPNPLNPKRYVVLNSGFTFREYDYLNNARQVPKLPDYAIIDVNQPVTGQKPGGIATAGFFDEEWKLKKEK
jgi:pimeloyl-ACP methyl ester carboxylesterase